MHDERPEPDDTEAPERGDAEGAYERARRAEAGAVKRSVSAAAEAARAPVSGVLRGSARATREGLALAEATTRVVYWPAQLCVLGAIVLQIGLPSKLTIGPRWLLPALEGALLLGLVATTPRGRVDVDHPTRRRVAIGLVAVVGAANAVDLYLLVHELLHKHISNGRALVVSGMAIWLTNVLIFALWYWLLDRGGPAQRMLHPDPTTPEGHPDWVFPEMDGGKDYTPAGWLPTFLDYLALAITTATAFSPTDAMPNSQRARVLMAAQGLISLVTIGLIIARAVGILG